MDFNDLASCENSNYYYDYLGFRKNYGIVSKFLIINEGEKMYKQYKLVFILAILTALITIIFFTVFLSFYNQYIQTYNDEKYKNFLAGKSQFTPMKNGLPWEQNVIFNQIGELSLKKNVILTGGSTTREGVLPDYILTNNWTLYNFGMSANTVYSDKVMLNYINNYSNHKLDKNDVVIFHIYYAYFVTRSPKSDYTRQVIENSGVYRVDDSGKVTGQMSDVQKRLLLTKYKFNYFYPKALPVLSQSITNFFSRNPDSSKKSLYNFNPKSSGPDEQKLKKYEKSWSDFTVSTSYPNKNTAEFEELILQFNNQTNVVVVNLYTPSWMRNYSREQEYEKWLENNLTPLLKTEKIPYFDFSSTIPDSDFADSAHLLIYGREKYTLLFDNEINRYLETLNISDDTDTGYKISPDNLISSQDVYFTPPSEDDNINSEIYYLGGWYWIENWNNVSTRWSAGNATLMFYSDSHQNGSLSLGALSYRSPRNLTIIYQDEILENFTISSNRIIPIRVPMSIQKGTNIIRLYVPDGCERPRDNSEKNSTDSRCLSIAIQNVSIS